MSDPADEDHPGGRFCECEGPWHGLDGCLNEPAEQETVDGRAIRTSPALCLPCLYGCMLDLEDAER